MLFIIFLGQNYYSSYKLKKEISFLKVKYEILKQRNNKHLFVLKILQNKITILNKKYNKINNQIDNITQKINILFNKNKKPLIYNIFAKLTFYLQKYDLKVKEIKKTDNKYFLKIVSKFNNTHEIAKFMQDLINENFKDVTSKTIKVNKNKYISYVEFEK